MKRFTRLTLLMVIAPRIDRSQLSLKEHYIVVTKDSDFVETFLVRREPWKLLLVSTGNINNASLEALFSATIPRVVEGFNDFHFIEIGRTSLIFHS
jgi:predicted nuclease of predicted toxin-antitoxin system